MQAQQIVSDQVIKVKTIVLRFIYSFFYFLIADHLKMINKVYLTFLTNLAMIMIVFVAKSLSKA